MAKLVEKVFEITLYHTIQNFKDLENEGFSKRGKRRKCFKPAFCPFSKMIYIFPKPILFFSFSFILSSANAFYLDQTEILLFGKEIRRKCWL